jgi:hypothetical protein
LNCLRSHKHLQYRWILFVIPLAFYF